MRHYHGDNDNTERFEHNATHSENIRHDEDPVNGFRINLSTRIIFTRKNIIALGTLKA